MTPKIEIFGQHFAHFSGFEGSFLTILGAKKVVFWPFSKLFRNFLSIVFRYLYSLLPIADILLWGPADALPNEKSAGF